MIPAVPYGYSIALHQYRALVNPEVGTRYRGTVLLGRPVAVPVFQASRAEHKRARYFTVLHTVEFFAGKR